MSIVTCKKCGAKVSAEYSYCTNCRAPIKGKAKRQISSGTQEGALIGGFVGFIYGIDRAAEFYLIILPFLPPSLLERIVGILTGGQMLQSSSIWNTAMAMIGALIVIRNVIAGFVLGALFIAFRERIPGGSTLRKAVFFSFVLFAIRFVAGMSNLLFSNPTYSGLAQGAFISISLPLYALAIVEYPLLGCLFGYLLDRRWRPKLARRITAKQTKSNRLSEQMKGCRYLNPYTSI